MILRTTCPWCCLFAAAFLLVGSFPLLLHERELVRFIGYIPLFAGSALFATAVVEWVERAGEREIVRHRDGCTPS